MRINKGIIFSLSFLAISVVSSTASAIGLCPCSPPSLTFQNPTLELIRDDFKRCRYYFDGGVNAKWNGWYYFRGRGACEGKDSSCTGKQECLSNWTPTISAATKNEENFCWYQNLSGPYDNTVKSSDLANVTPGGNQVTRNTDPSLCDQLLYPTSITFSGHVTKSHPINGNSNLSKCHYIIPEGGGEGWYYFAGSGECQASWAPNTSTSTFVLASRAECKRRVKGPADNTLTGTYADYASQNMIYKSIGCTNR